MNENPINLNEIIAPAFYNDGIWLYNSLGRIVALYWNNFKERKGIHLGAMTIYL